MIYMISAQSLQSNTLISADLSASANNVTIYFRVMDYAKTKCATYANYYAVLFNDSDPTQCKPLTKGMLSPNNFSGNSNDSTVITIAYSPNNAFFTIVAVCGNSTNTPVLSISDNSYTVQIMSPSLCAVEVNTKSFWTLYSTNKIIFAIVFWVLGIMLIGLGLKMFGIILGVIGFLAADMTLNVIS